MIIGANGMVGAEIMKCCLAQGWETGCVYHTNDGYIDPQCRKIPFSQFETCKDVYDYVFLAAGNFSNSHQELVTNNVLLPMRCTEKFKSARLVFISSTNVYGTHPGVITETSSFNNPGPYGLSKISGEFIIQSHPNYCILRPSVILGKRINPNTFIARLLRAAKYDKEIVLFGNGERRQDYIPVPDIGAISMRAAVLEPDLCLLAVYGRSFSNAEIAEYVRTISDCRISFQGEDKAPSFEFNSSYSNEVVGYTRRADFFDSLKEIYESI